MDAATAPAGRPESVSFTTAKGVALRVDLAVEPLVSLRHQTTAAVRIEPTLVLEDSNEPVSSRVFGRLSDDDTTRIDQATIDFAGHLLSQGVAQPAIVLPVSFFTMAARRGRLALATMPGATPELLKSSVMVEFTDVDRGTPVSRLTEVGTFVNTICRAVLVRVQPGKDMLAAVRGYRPHGITLDAVDLGQVEARIASQMLEFGDQARGAAPLLIVQGLPNDGFFQVAEVAGLSHASVRASGADRQRSAA